jgi:hypothetical protein
VGTSTITQRRQADERSLLDGALDPALTPEACDLEHWLHATQRALVGLTRGHARDAVVPRHMLEPSPLREASLREFAFRATTEELTARNLSHLVLAAPDRACMDFFATQLLDEARHADVFRWHLVELGVPRASLDAAMQEIVGERRRTILSPLEAFALDLVGGPRPDFIGGVIFLTVIGEGALAPAAEMSERKWQRLDPPAAEIARGANLDEIRHLGVGTAVVRRYVLEHPHERDRLTALVEQGVRLWERLPVLDLLVEREVLFQQGMARHLPLLDGYELVPGRPLADTTVEERIALQSTWSMQMKRERLAVMGLGEAAAD